MFNSRSSNRRNRRFTAVAATALISGLSLVTAFDTAAHALPRRGTDTPITVRPPVTTRPPTPTTPTLPPVVLAGKRIPKYKIEALNFTADDESGIDWTGSDEPKFVFSWTDGNRVITQESPEFGDVDSGDTRNFGLTCLMADCTKGSAAPMSVTAQLFEIDESPAAGALAAKVLEVLNGQQGIKPYIDAIRTIGYNLDALLDGYFTSLFGDDLMGSTVLTWQQADFDAVLHAPGDVYIETVHLGEHGGDLPNWLDNPPDYTLRLKVTRLADEIVPLVATRA